MAEQPSRHYRRPTPDELALCFGCFERPEENHAYTLYVFDGLSITESLFEYFPLWGIVKTDNEIVHDCGIRERLTSLDDATLALSARWCNSPEESFSWLDWCDQAGKTLAAALRNMSRSDLDHSKWGLVFEHPAWVSPRVCEAFYTPAGENPPANAHQFTLKNTLERGRSLSSGQAEATLCQCDARYELQVIGKDNAKPILQSLLLYEFGEKLSLSEANQKGPFSLFPSNKNIPTDLIITRTNNEQVRTLGYTVTEIDPFEFTTSFAFPSPEPDIVSPDGSKKRSQARPNFTFETDPKHKPFRILTMVETDKMDQPTIVACLEKMKTVFEKVSTDFPGTRYRLIGVGSPPIEPIANDLSTVPFESSRLQTGITEGFVALSTWKTHIDNLKYVFFNQGFSALNDALWTAIGSDWDPDGVNWLILIGRSIPYEKDKHLSRWKRMFLFNNRSRKTWSEKRDMILRKGVHIATIFTGNPHAGDIEHTEGRSRAFSHTFCSNGHFYHKDFTHDDLLTLLTSGEHTEYIIHCDYALPLLKEGLT